MFISNSNLALWLIERYKSAWDKGNPKLETQLGSLEGEFSYALMTIKNKTQKGIGVDVYNKDVMEIGCGRGGICLFIAMNGANKVTGVDISTEALDTAEKITASFAEKGLVNANKLEFRKEFVENMSFPDESFDVIIADNILEHVNDLDATVKECARVLRKDGILYVPNFPPIYSRFGPHLKYGSKIPWLHIFFTEKAICDAVYKRAVKYPDLKLFDWYPCLKDHPATFRDIRRYKDMNYITNKKFKEAVSKSNMKLVKLHSKRSKIQKILLTILPFLKNGIMGDIFSYGTLAIAKK
jgi:ubiquinone/menaquinone biosynthesis C-methylase UbiE